MVASADEREESDTEDDEEFEHASIVAMRSVIDKILYYFNIFVCLRIDSTNYCQLSLRFILIVLSMFQECLSDFFIDQFRGVLLQGLRKRYRMESNEIL